MNCKKILIGLSVFSFVFISQVMPINAEQGVVARQSIDSISEVEFEQMIEKNDTLIEKEVLIEEEASKGEKEVSQDIVLEKDENNSLGYRVVQTALSHRGKPYVYGANGPSAFDCSGFVKYVMDQNGISIPRTSQSQAYGGQRVDKSNLQLGDIIAFNTYGSLSHVGIYIGEGNFIHASSYKGGVRIDSIYSNYYSPRYAWAVRYQ